MMIPPKEYRSTCAPLDGKPPRSRNISSRGKREPNSSKKHVYISIVLAIIFLDCHYDPVTDKEEAISSTLRGHKRLILLANSHIVLTKDDNGQSLVLTGEDGNRGKGKGKGGGNNDRLVIAGQNGGGSENSNMVMQDASEREGDVVINGNSMIVPGEDGHIVLADTRSSQQRRQPPQVNFWALWAPYLRGRGAYNNPFFGFPFG